VLINTYPEDSSKIIKGFFKEHMFLRHYPLLTS